MNPHFDLGSAAMLEILDEFGVMHINAVEIMETMKFRGTIHFDNSRAPRRHGNHAGKTPSSSWPKADTVRLDRNGKVRVDSGCRA